MSRLYPCAYCTEDGYCKKYSDDEVTSWCVQGPCKDEKPSNADRFRSMTDEELAVFFARAAPLLINQFAAVKSAMTTEDKAIRTWLDWLKQEASE